MTTDTSAVNDGPAGASHPEPFTQEWVEWLAEALSGCAVDSHADIVLAHSATESDGSQFSWQMRIRDGIVTVTAGLPGEADESRTVRFRSSRETAWAIAAEGQSAQRAVLEGRMAVQGDMRLLLRSRRAVQQISEALSATRGPGS